MFESFDISLRNSVVRGFGKAGKLNMRLDHRNEKEGDMEDVKRELDLTNKEDFSK